ncbi:MAG: serine/threonine protein kinase, partial [Myxococcales bacterium]|nr:serine/threonine protein kinase [Myxococcales bacterium]
MDTLAELDDLGADAPAEPRRDPVASVDSAEGSLTPEGEPSIPRGQQSYTQHRIGAMVLQRLFDREPPALRIGRFSVLERIGRGGMGTVYAAYDEQLDRKVAVKVLRGDERSGEVARHRLQREAQAMARLSHPNVVTVHEVGESDGDVFVAMEFIRGQSLDAWIRTEPDWREVLEVFVQAGRGLIAAHEAGLIHRDLKPHNVMRSDDGVVKVLDFGLARAASDDSLDRAEVPSTESSEGSALRTDITRPGAVLGTPAYMSPEQHRGLPADARSDQFSFCVALYEALYRQRPFRAPTLVALVHAVRSGELRAPPAEPRVPAWIHRIVVRGLSLEPKDRWPSMQALISALERDPSRAHRRWWVAAGLGSLAGLLGFGLAGLLGEPATPRCPPASAEQQALWPAARQARVAAAFETSGSPLATDTLARVSPMIDAYVGELGHMRAEACLAHRRGDQSARLLDLRTACLDVRRAGLDELLAGLEQADADTVHSAAWAAASLPSVEPCGDTEALTATVPPPDDAAVARQVQHEREALASAASMVLAGSYDEASARVEASLRAAEALGYTPLVAEARLGLGAALMEAHEHERALEALSGGLQAALRSGHDEVAVEALARRMWVRADPLRRPTEALGDDEIADALLEKLGRPALLEWLLLNNRGVAQFRAGLRSDAERSYREALASLGRQGEQLHPVQHISTRFNLAMLLWAGLGEPAAAADELRSALDRARELLGPEHPRVTVISARLAAILVVAGRHEEARALLDACLARVTDDD